MIASKKVFIAPDALITFIDRADSKHIHSSAFFRYFGQGGYQLYTDIISINYAYDKIFKDISPSVAKDFLRAMIISSFNILYPDESDMKATIKILAADQSAELAFSKALMAVFCNRRSIPQICTFEYLHPLFGLQLFYLPI